MRHAGGIGPVRELLIRRASQVRGLLVDPRRSRADGRDPVAELVQLARAAGVKVEERSAQALDQVVGPELRHQGVVAVLGDFEYADLQDVVEQAIAASRPALVVALDGVEDPRNLGAIVRSAYLLGADAVVIPAQRAAPVTPVVSKTSAGAAELMPIAQVGNLARALGELKQLGLWNVAVHAAPKARPLGDVDLRGPICLVLGAEGRGVRPLVAQQCDFHAIIPMMAGGVGSFNVSVAAAIALYEVQRQRAGSAADQA
jgi:23S rRNA (guanosine2251-2'-O)-methyltransferase